MFTIAFNVLPYGRLLVSGSANNYCATIAAILHPLC